MGSKKSPQAVPNPAKVYAEGIATNLKYAPAVASAESRLRGEYDNNWIEESLGRQKEFAPKFKNLYSDAISQVSPWANTARKNVGRIVSENLAKGYTLSDGQKREAEQSARSWQAASGNILGNAAVGAEASEVGWAAQTQRQRSLWDANNFLKADDTLKQFTATSLFMQGAAAPDRGNAYVTPATGGFAQGLANQAYQQNLNYLRSLDSRDYYGTWDRTLNGLRMGWTEGSLGGIWGGVFGAVFGAIDAAGDGPIYNIQLDYGFGGAQASPLYKG